MSLKTPAQFRFVLQNRTLADLASFRKYRALRPSPLAAALYASTPAPGSFGPGWMNEAYNGHLRSQQADIGDSGMLDVTSTDAYIAVVPFGPSPGYTGPNSGKFQVVGNFAFWHPNPFCFPMVPPGIPAYVDEVGTEWIFGYTRDFDKSGDKVDPTPEIDSVTLDRPLVEGDTSVATILGQNFGISMPTVSMTCSSSDNPSPPCTNSDVTATVTQWTSSSITATLTASSTALGDYDLTVTSNGTPTYGNNFQQGPGPGPQNQATQPRAATAITPNMKLQLLATVISTDGNYSENSTVQVTAVRPDTGVTIAGFKGTVNLSELAQPDGFFIYRRGDMPSSVSITSGGATNFLASSLAGPDSIASPNTAPPAARIFTSNYPMYLGGTLTIPQWIISGNQIDTHAGIGTYDWFQTRARDIFVNATGDTATILQAVSTYSVGFPPGGVAGYANRGRGPQTSIVINPFFTQVRQNGSGGTLCNQVSTHAFIDVLLHEARHGYQFAQTAVNGLNQSGNWVNDQDGDYLVGNPVSVVPLAPNNIQYFQDTSAMRTVCNEFTNPPFGDANFMRGYLGDNMPDLDPSPPMPGDRSAYVSYALEMDAEAFAASHNNDMGLPQH